MQRDDFDLIVSDPAVLGGKPCIRGTRISGPSILELVASGGTIPEILHGWPDLTADAVEQALRYAATFVENDVLIAVDIAS